MSNNEHFEEAKRIVDSWPDWKKASCELLFGTNSYGKPMHSILCNCTECTECRKGK